MATYAIGDIHGRLDLLRELLSRLSPGEDDTVVFLGDYIDRGPDSRGVIQHLIEYRESSDAAVAFLLGNHEQLLLRTLDDYSRHTWILGMNGMDTVRSYAPEAAQNLEDSLRDAGPSLFVGKHTLPYGVFFDHVPPAHLDFFRSLSPFFRSPDVVCVHAGVTPESVRVEDEAMNTLVWSEPEWWQRYSGEDRIVYGHWNNAATHHGRATVKQYGRTFGIDSVAGNQLLAIRFPDLQEWCVDTPPQKQ